MIDQSNLIYDGMGCGKGISNVSTLAIVIIFSIGSIKVIFKRLNNSKLFGVNLIFEEIAISDSYKQISSHICADVQAKIEPLAIVS